MKLIPVVRFNALAGYARMPGARAAAQELAWFEHAEGRVLGTLIQDRNDGDFGGVVFAQDQMLRFRAVDVTGFDQSRRRAKVALRRAIEAASAASPEKHFQGDEQGPPIDFFAYRRPREELNADFVGLAESEGYSAARRIIEPMMRWYEDADGNFIEQFQTTGFDQRIWELYLFAVFTELGYQVDRSVAAPDFMCSGLFGSFCVEAVTVGPTRRDGVVVPPPRVDTPEEMKAFLCNYMPIKFGSALFSKLRKEYWKQAHVVGKPLLLAIEDFSAPGSMTRTRSALETYLYGYEYEWNHDEAGKLNIIPRKIESHKWEDKTIPSGFFDLPGAENISAVIFSNSGTIAKFSRMGIVADFSSPSVLVFREGMVVNHDPNAAAPKRFHQLVNAPDYHETWVEGLDVFHNPKALLPLEQHTLPGAAHHFVQQNGEHITLAPDWHPLASFTRHHSPIDVAAILTKLGHLPSQMIEEILLRAVREVQNRKGQ